MEYVTIDNGVKKFSVVIVDTVNNDGIPCKRYFVYEFRNPYSETESEYLLKHGTFVNYWVGKDTRNPGRGVLFQLTDTKYIEFGSCVCEFELDSDSEMIDPIVDYEVYVGNNDLTYRFAISNDSVYVLPDAMKIPISEYKSCENVKDFTSKLYCSGNAVPVKMFDCFSYHYRNQMSLFD